MSPVDDVGTAVGSGLGNLLGNLLKEKKDVTNRELEEMEDVEDRDESLAAHDREMLENLHLHFGRGPGEPRSWEEMSEEGREYIRGLYWKAMGEATSGG